MADRNATLGHVTIRHTSNLIPCIIRICLRNVDFPLSPAPRSRSLTCLRKVCRSFSSIRSISWLLYRCSISSGLNLNRRQQVHDHVSDPAILLYPRFTPWTRFTHFSYLSFVYSLLSLSLNKEMSSSIYSVFVRGTNTLYYDVRWHTIILRARPPSTHRRSRSRSLHPLTTNTNMHEAARG